MDPIDINPATETIKAAREMIEEIELDGKIMSEVARTYKTYFDELVNAGFTEDQAIKIVTELPLPL